MGDPRHDLEHLGKLAATNPAKRFGKLYKLVRNPALIALAAERVRQNTGGRTAGIDGQTRAAIDEELLRGLVEDLAQHRYQPQAVDYLVVLCQHSKAEAQQLKETMAVWLEQELGLTQHPEKTRITHWDTRLRFLGYDLRGRRNPNGTRWLRLSIPPEKERELKAKVKHLCGYTQIPELDLVMSVNALLRGWSNYFRYANDAPHRFAYLTGVVYWLGARFLGRKHRGCKDRFRSGRFEGKSRDKGVTGAAAVVDRTQSEDWEEGCYGRWNAAPFT
jgi:hypothetical protein